MSLGLSQSSKWTHLGVDQTDCVRDRDGDKSLSWLHSDVDEWRADRSTDGASWLTLQDRVGVVTGGSCWWWLCPCVCISLCFWLCLTLWLPLIMDCGLCHLHSIPCFCVYLCVCHLSNKRCHRMDTSGSSHSLAFCHSPLKTQGQRVVVLDSNFQQKL